MPAPGARGGTPSTPRAEIARCLQAPRKRPSPTCQSPRRPHGAATKQPVRSTHGLSGIDSTLENRSKSVTSCENPTWTMLSGVRGCMGKCGVEPTEEHPSPAPIGSQDVALAASKQAHAGRRTVLHHRPRALSGLPVVSPQVRTSQATSELMRRWSAGMNAPAGDGDDAGL